MPQLDISTYLSQSFWLIIFFISLWIVLDRIIIPKISSIIEERKRKYNDTLYQIDKINDKAKEAYDKYDVCLNLAKTKADKQLRQQRHKLETFLLLKEAEIAKTIDKDLAANKQNVMQNRVDILAQADVISQELSILILKNLGIDFLINNNNSKQNKEVL